MRRVWFLAFFGYLALQLGWSLGVPVNGTYDEAQHISRAYGVASGQVYAKGYYFEGPASLLPAHLQCTGAAPLAAGCQTPAPEAGTPAGNAIVRWPSAAARYSPLYYLPVGIPLLISPDQAGVIGARVVSALLSALLLASAVAIAFGAGNRLLLGGLLLVATPLVANLGGSVNPNGLEISAGILTWTALLLLVRPASTSPRERPLLVAFGVGAGLLLTVRHMGPVLLGVIVLACALLARRGQLKELWVRRDARWVLAGIAGAALLGVAWMLTSAVNDIPPNPNRAVHLSLAKTIEQIVRIRTPFYLNQVVGQFSEGELTLPSWVILGWYALVAALTVPALLLAGRRYRLAWVGTAAVCFGVLAALELWFVPRLGWYSHGRYAMPAGVGLVLMAAFTRGFDGEFPQRFVRFVAIVTGLLHGYALAEVTLRYRVHVTSLPSPAYAVTAGAVGVMLLMFLGWSDLTARPSLISYNSDRKNNVGRSSEDEARTMAH